MANQPYQLLIFDWDGTLLDSHQFIISCVRDACAELGLICPDDAIIRAQIGVSIEMAVMDLLPDISINTAKRLIETYRKYFLQPGRAQAMLFHDTLVTLKQLKGLGYELAIATGKSRTGLDRDLAEVGIANLFTATRTVDESASKPSPEMVESLMEQLGVAPQHTLVIGDSEYDLLMAKNANVDAVAVAYGAIDELYLPPEICLATINSLAELPAWLKKR